MRFRLIWDNGTPNCLPSWAADEIVRRRMENYEMSLEISRLRVELAVATGTERQAAFTDELRRQMDDLAALS